MPRLNNMRHEAFAQGLYKGETADQAYKNAGYKPNRGNAIRLKASESIQKRVGELHDRGQRVSDITKESLTALLMKERKAANEVGQHSAAVSALEKVGKLHGLFIEKTENQNLNMHMDISDEPALSDEEWADSYKPH